jgi:hypothetical protein
MADISLTSFENISENACHPVTFGRILPAGQVTSWMNVGSVHTIRQIFPRTTGF